jgi:hypothetical protein
MKRTLTGFSPSTARLLSGMHQSDINMRVAAVVDFLDRHGPSTTKTISLSLGHSENYATPYLQAGRESGKIVEVSRKQPIKWGLPKHLAPRLLPALKATPAAGTETVSVAPNIMKTIKVLRIFHGYETNEEVVAHAINQHAAEVVTRHKVSLRLIEEEMDRHEAEMTKLRKGT